MDLWRAVRSLPGRQRQAVALFYLEDWPTAEIARFFGRTETTVRGHLHRGRAALARRLGEGWEESERRHQRPPRRPSPAPGQRAPRPLPDLDRLRRRHRRRTAGRVGMVRATMPAPGTPRPAGMAVDGGLIWLSDPAGGRLLRIGPAVAGRP